MINIRIENKIIIIQYKLCGFKTRVYSQTNSVGCAACYPKPLRTLNVRPKSVFFPRGFSLPCLLPDQTFDTLFKTRPLNQYPVPDLPYN